MFNLGTYFPDAFTVCSLIQSCFRYTKVFPLKKNTLFSRQLTCTTR